MSASLIRPRSKLWMGVCLVLLTAVSCFWCATPLRADQPNILWISCEDTSSWFGFCGDPAAHTPTLDRLAREGVYYRNVFATAPVCSPSRYAIITGTYATSYGTQRLRSHFPIPDAMTGFPAYLRRAGYYCSNNVKTDYNTSAEKRIVAEAWDESSGKAHWRKRKPGQPFFAVFNLMETHQSRIFEGTPAPQLEPSERHDPDRMTPPPFYPDIPSARRAMARVYDCITAMDKRAGAILAELEQDGLKDNTIIFFWPDHGQGIPRGKRTLWDTGLRVPMVVYLPEKYRHWAPVAPGGSCDQLVSLMDLGPTLLSILNLPIPAYMQGRAFLGAAATAPRDFIFGARDRVDEAMELSRSARDARYLYIHNFMPDISWNQPETYSDQLELRRDITRLTANPEAKYTAAQQAYAGPRKSVEALYDTHGDPWQTKNLVGDPAYDAVLERMRNALRTWQIETRDIGFIHEAEAARLTAEGMPLAELARDETIYPIERVLDTAWGVGRPSEKDLWLRRLTDRNPTVRYWAALGLRAGGFDSPDVEEALAKALKDASPPVVVEAAGILAGRYNRRDALDRLSSLLTDADENIGLHAARTMQLLGEKARPSLPALRAALPRVKAMYTRWCIQGAIAELTGTENPVFKTR